MEREGANKEVNPAKKPPSTFRWRETASRRRVKKFIQQKQNKVDPKAGDTVRAKE